jgi:hypothetical protein
MLRDQMINFLETTVIFLLLTNAVSIFAAVYAMSVANGGRALHAVVRKSNAAIWPRDRR